VRGNGETAWLKTSRVYSRLMGVFPGNEGKFISGGPRREHRQIELYGHVEGLVAEETELLEIEEDKRTGEQHHRLRAISEELDRVMEHLHARAHRHGRAAPGDGAPGPTP
jgi:hypothetical protein